MKREIKYRAILKNEHSFRDVYGIDFARAKVMVSIAGYWEWIEYKTLVEFIGLKDKNGKEIYEGDVVKTETEKEMQVCWNPHFASFCLDRDGWMFTHYFGEAVNPDQIEVIGNIYENPGILN